MTQSFNIFVFATTEQNEEVFIFVDSMCRSLNMRPEAEPVMLGEVETWKYVLPSETLLNGDDDPDNGGFCVGPAGKCSPRNCISNRAS